MGKVYATFTRHACNLPLWNMELGTVALVLHKAFIYFLGTVIPARGRVAINRYRSVRALDESPPGGEGNPLREDHALEDLDRG